MEATPTLSPADLPATWRERAALLAEFGDPNSARLWHIAAAESQEALRVLDEESLSPTEAAQLSGYTSDHIAALIRNNKIPNIGRKYAPRLRRGDLPNKKPKKGGRPPKKREETVAAKDISPIANKLR